MCYIARCPTKSDIDLALKNAAGKDALALGQPEWVVGFVLGVVTLLAGIVLVASSSIPQVRVDSKTPGLV